jgi:phosphoglycolate phosphatase-like HAD superfamily hydrolase
MGVFSRSTYDECCKIYETEKLRAVYPYPNAIPTIRELKNMGLKIAILTDAHSKNAKKRLERPVFFNGWMLSSVRTSQVQANLRIKLSFLLWKHLT